MCLERASVMDEEGGEDEHSRHQLFTRADLQQWDREAVRKSLFAQTLQKKLRRLQGRRTSEPMDVMTAAQDGKATSKDDLFVKHKEANVVGNDDEEDELDLVLAAERGLDKGRMNFLLGRFLSGSDPSLCSTAAMSVSTYSSESGSSRSDSLEGGINLEGGAFGEGVDRAKMAAEIAAENGSEPPTLKLLCSNSSGYGSERDIRENEVGAEMRAAEEESRETDVEDTTDFLVPHAWVNKHFSPSGSNSSGYSTPTPTPTPADFVRDSSPAFESHVSDVDALSSTPRADEGIFFSAKPNPLTPSLSPRQPEFLTITSGEEKHNVATTKLNALIALLDSSSSSTSARTTNKLSRSAPDLLAAKDFSYGQDASSFDTSGASGRSVDDADGPRSLVMDDELKAQKPNKMRKASSLKTGKTPPGTPGRAKIVRFADVLGLDLAYVKHVMTDEVPNVPKCAYDDLEFDHPELEVQNENSNSLTPHFPHSPMRSSTNLLQPSSLLAPPARLPTHSTSTPSLSPGSLVPMFAQPGSLPDMHDVLRERKICLERALSPRAGLVVGTCAVCNLSFEKRVSVRASTDEWATSWDVDCSYVDGSCDGFSDRFKFQVEFAPLPVGRRMQICLRFVAVGVGEFWDSNAGNNYVFQCAAPANQQSEDPWFNNVHNY